MNIFRLLRDIMSIYIFILSNSQLRKYKQYNWIYIYHAVDIERRIPQSGLRLEVHSNIKAQLV